MSFLSNRYLQLQRVWDRRWWANTTWLQHPDGLGHNEGGGWCNALSKKTCNSRAGVSDLKNGAVWQRRGKPLERDTSLRNLAITQGRVTEARLTGHWKWICLREYFDISKHQFPYIENGHNNSCYLMWLLWELQKTATVMITLLARCLCVTLVVIIFLVTFSSVLAIFSNVPNF